MNWKHLLRVIFVNQPQARAWVNQGGLKVVAHCMFHLNQLARRIPGDYVGTKFHIYLLKSRLIEYLYLNGHCTAVDQQIQKLPCWHTREYNEGWDSYCWKCHGSGIYHQHILYRFVFDVNGRTYVWHQPERLINFIGLLRWEGETLPEFHATEMTHNPMLHGNRQLTSVYMAAVAHFLVKAGMDGDGEVSEAGLLSVFDVIRELKKGVNYGFKRQRRIFSNRARSWLAMRVPERYRDRIDPNWDIPF